MIRFFVLLCFCVFFCGFRDLVFCFALLWVVLWVFLLLWFFVVFCFAFCCFKLTFILLLIKHLKLPITDIMPYVLVSLANSTNVHFFWKLNKSFLWFAFANRHILILFIYFNTPRCFDWCTANETDHTLASAGNIDLQNARACTNHISTHISGSHSGSRDLTCSRWLRSDTRQVNSSPEFGRS